MSCPEHRELQDLVDGTSPDEVRSRLAEHVAGCDRCRAELAEIERLVTAARELRHDEPPERDLWPGIEAEIRRAGRPGRRRPSWLGLAAAAMLLVALTWTVVSRQGDAPTADVDEPVVATVADPLSLGRVAAERERSESGQMHVRTDLLRTLAVRDSRLDPATRELVDRNMEIIDRAVAELATAREEYPQNRALGSLLARTYQREAALLKQINRL